MTENNQNDEAQGSNEEQLAKLAANMSDDDEKSDDNEISDDLQEKKENPFLFPPIEPHYRNDSE
jgi:hypothetical protein